MEFTPIYVSANTFKILGDKRAWFVATERVQVDCDGTLVWSSIDTVSFDSTYTIVVLTKSVLTDPCTTARVGGVYSGTTGNLPPHTHEDDDTGGSGVVGAPPAHELRNYDTEIRFRNPDGSWGEWMAFGYSYREIWTSGHTYSFNELVIYEGTLYGCLYSHTADSTTEPGIGVYWTSYWFVMTSILGGSGGGVTYQGEWTEATDYVVGDIVLAGIINYLCYEVNLSDATTEPGVGTYWASYWISFGSGEGGGIPDTLHGVVFANLTDPATAILPDYGDQYLVSTFDGGIKSAHWVDVPGPVTDPIVITNLRRGALRQQKTDYLQAGSGVATSASYDALDDWSGIDWGSSTAYGDGPPNVITPVATDLTTPVDIFSQSTYLTNYVTFSNEHHRILLPIGVLSSGDIYVRVNLYARSGHNSVLDHVTIAEDAGTPATADAADVLGSDKFKEFLFSGVQGCTVTNAAYKTSDWLTFTVDQALAYWIGVSAAGSTALSSAPHSGSPGFYSKATSAADWDSQTLSGYGLTSSYAECVAFIEVCGGELGSDMVVISNPMSISETIAHVSAALMLKNMGANTKVYVSTASSPSWTEITSLTQLLADVEATGVNQYNSSNIAVTGSSDKQLRWKVVGPKDDLPLVEFRGIVMGWTAS